MKLDTMSIVLDKIRCHEARLDLVSNSYTIQTLMLALVFLTHLNSDERMHYVLQAAKPYQTMG